MTTNHSDSCSQRGVPAIARKLIALFTVLLLASHSARLHAQSTPQSAQPAAAPAAAPAAGSSGAKSTSGSAVQLQTIQITGTRIVTNGYKEPTPVTVAPTNLLLQSTPTDLADALNATLPQFLNSPSPSRATHNFTSSAENGNILNLRGVGGQETLILFDGIRMPPTTYLGEVDIDVLPEMLVQRTDVVTGGASAVYGSDAVAGVVNFVLDRNFTGVKAEAQYGESQAGDNENYRVGVAGGTDLFDGRAHVLVSLETYNDDGMLRSDRAAGRADYAYVGSTPGTALPGSAANPYVSVPNISIPISSPTGLMLSGPLAGEQFAPGGTSVIPFNAGTPTGTPGYNQNGQGLMIPSNVSAIAPLNTKKAFGRFSFDISPDITAHIQGAYARSEVDYSLEANGFVLPTPATLFSGNPYLPSDLQSALTSTNTDSVLVDIYPFASPPATSEVTQFYFVNAGLDGALGSNWTWQADYTHGHSVDNVNQNNTLEWRNTLAAIDAVKNSSGQTVCNASLSSDPTIAARYANCQPLDILDPASTPAGLAYAMGDSAYEATVSQDTADVSLSGNLFELPAGEVGAAVGGEYRNETLGLTSNSNPALLFTAAEQSAYFAGLRDVPAGLNTAYWLTDTGTASGSVNVKEGFGEISVPLLKDKPLARSLALSGAARITDYSTSGTVDTWKAGATWGPIRDLLFRGTLSADIRAPTLYDLDAGPQFGIGQVTDPVTNTTANLETISSGNSKLQPEKGRTLTFGVVLTPRFLEGFQASVDWYRLDISGAIGSISAQQILLDCYNSRGTSPDCDFISRPTPTSFPTSVTLAPLNSQFELTEGWDIDGSYTQHLGPGQFSARLFGNYLDRFVNPQLGSSANLAGFALNGNQPLAFPRERATLDLDYRVGRMDVFASEQFIGRLDLSAPIPDNLYVNPEVAAVWYTNLTLDHSMVIEGIETHVFFTVDNLFNRQFPVIPGTIPGLNVPTIISLYDTVGRAFTLGVRAEL